LAKSAEKKRNNTKKKIHKIQQQTYTGTQLAIDILRRGLSSTRPSIYFSSSVKSPSNQLLEPMRTKQ